MNIKVLLFAHLRERLGLSELIVQVPLGTQVKSIFSSLFAQNADLQHLIPSLLCAVNKKHVSSDYVLQDNDELAIIPPVAGG